MGLKQDAYGLFYCARGEEQMCRQASLGDVRPVRRTLGESEDLNPQDHSAFSNLVCRDQSIGRGFQRSNCPGAHGRDSPYVRLNDNTIRIGDLPA